jgi:hypothetical protein
MPLHLVTYELTDTTISYYPKTKLVLVDCADEEEALALLETKHPITYCGVEILEFEPVLSNQNTKKT